jgi:hypothetical protein
MAGLPGTRSPPTARTIAHSVPVPGHGLPAATAPGHPDHPDDSRARLTEADYRGGHDTDQEPDKRRPDLT